MQGIFFNQFANSYIPNIMEEIWIKKIYQPFLTGKRDLIIADWGGNIGLTSYFFKDYAKQVYCVEPAKQHIEVINKLIEFNKITNITVCPYAISNKNGIEKFYHNENVTMFSLSDLVNKDKDDFEEVETVTVKEFFIRNKLDHIDLLKLDVEGNESKVINSDEFKEYAPKIKLIIGEWHSWDTQNQTMFADTFRDLGYVFNWLPNMKAACFTAIRI
jgi:FkbM family methyltransferase